MLIETFITRCRDLKTRRTVRFPSTSAWVKWVVVEHGLTLSSEEHSPARLVEIAVAAEEAGFDFVSISDHFHPWISEQGHSPFVWSVLGALSHATSDLKVGVGSPVPLFACIPRSAPMRLPLRHVYSTAGSLGSRDRRSPQRTHSGDPWPPADVRLEMLEEAIEIVRGLWRGESFTHRGCHYTVEDARIFDVPEELPPIVVSAFGDEAVELASRIGDGL